MRISTDQVYRILDILNASIDIKFQHMMTSNFGVTRKRVGVGTTVDFLTRPNNTIIIPSLNEILVSQFGDSNIISNIDPSPNSPPVDPSHPPPSSYHPSSLHPPSSYHQHQHQPSSLTNLSLTDSLYSPGIEETDVINIDGKTFLLQQKYPERIKICMSNIFRVEYKKEVANYLANRLSELTFKTAVHSMRSIDENVEIEQTPTSMDDFKDTHIGNQKVIIRYFFDDLNLISNNISPQIRDQYMESMRYITIQSFRQINAYTMILNQHSYGDVNKVLNIPLDYGIYLPLNSGETGYWKRGSNIHKLDCMNDKYTLSANDKIIKKAMVSGQKIVYYSGDVKYKLMIGGGFEIANAIVLQCKSDSCSTGNETDESMSLSTICYNNDEKCYDEKCYDEKCYDEKCYDEKCYDETHVSIETRLKELNIQANISNTIDMSSLTRAYDTDTQHDDNNSLLHTIFIP